MFNNIEHCKDNEQIRTLLLQVDDVIAQDNAAKKEGVEFTADLLSEISEELNKSLESVPEPKTTYTNRCES